MHKAHYSIGISLGRYRVEEQGLVTAGEEAGGNSQLASFASK